jgi:YD repeat-containing protein
LTICGIGWRRNEYDAGTGYQKQSKLEQRLDDWGNLVRVKQYDYGDLVSPKRVYAVDYNLSSVYVARNLFNIVHEVRLTANGRTTTLLHNYTDDYSGGTYGGPLCPSFSFSMVDTPGARQLNTLVSDWRGNVTERSTPAGLECYRYDRAGNVVAAADSLGAYAALPADSGKNYAVPSVLMPNGDAAKQESMSYTAWLGITSDTLPNNSTTSVLYDSLQRPSEVTLPYGAKRVFSYANTAPHVTETAQSTAADNGRWTKSSFDGIGRAAKVEAGSGATTVSTVEKEYEACACSPIGKVKRVSRPYGPGGTKYWTTYSFDPRGRTTRVDQPNGSGAMTYLYEGNAVKVTDPGGRWKKYESDAFGQLTKVIEPNPAGGADLETLYFYDEFGHLTEARMTRGSVTQTRTFVYNAQQRLQSMTLPESGTTTYTWNIDGTLWYKIDAKNQKIEYVYDSYKRVTQIKKYPVSSGAEDSYQRQTFTYDAGAGWQTNLQGRLAVASYRTGPNLQDPVEERYSYTSAGLPKVKKWSMWRTGVELPLQASYSYDAEGRRTSMVYPAGYLTTPTTLTNTFDTMGRLTSVQNAAGGAWAQNATYGPAGELLTLEFNGPAWTETRT